MEYLDDDDDNNEDKDLISYDQGPVGGLGAKPQDLHQPYCTTSTTNMHDIQRLCNVWIRLIHMSSIFPRISTTTCLLMELSGPTTDHLNHYHRQQGVARFLPDFDD